MSKSCATCVWLDPTFAPDDEDPSLALGLCEWPAERLPYSLRYGNRERLAVHPTDGETCSCHEPTIDPWKNINPRYKAYCLAHGEKHPDAMLAHDRERWPGGCMAGYINWINEQWRRFEIHALGPKGAGANRDLWRYANGPAFDEWLQAKVAP